MIANLTEGLHNLSSDIYHSDPCPQPSLSSSIANILITQSPLHAWMAHPRLNPNFQPEDVDSRMDIGSIAHAMLLERDESKVVVVSAPDWRTKAAREAREEAHAQDEHAILEHKYGAVQNMVKTAMSYIQTTELRNIFDTGIAEQSLFWQEGETWCKARPDLLSADRRVCLDYKTTESAQPDTFIRQIPRLGYDTQASWYSRGMGALGPETEFVFLAQEITEPYSCSLIGLSNAYKEVARLKVERALHIWRECVNTNRWPAYSTKILYAEPTSYQMAELENDRSTW
jgi:hypothetical protein